MTRIFHTLYENPIPTGWAGAGLAVSTAFWNWIDAARSIVALLGGILGLISASLAIVIMVLKLRNEQLSKDD